MAERRTPLRTPAPAIPRPRAPMRDTVLRAGGHGGPVPVTATEGADYANDSLELLAQEEAIRRAVRPGTPPWRKLVKNWVRFIADVVEGWAVEGRTFPSEAAKQAAIGALCLGALERLRRDPKRWMREHCDR